MKRKIYKISTELGRKLKIERIKQNLSQEKLAVMAGISIVAYGSIENGRSSPKIETLDKLAKALKIELYKLFIFED